jgi:hypothetical protein
MAGGHYNCVKNLSIPGHENVASLTSYLIMFFNCEKLLYQFFAMPHILRRALVGQGDSQMFFDTFYGHICSK